MRPRKTQHEITARVQKCSIKLLPVQKNAREEIYTYVSGTFGGTLSEREKKLLVFFKIHGVFGNKD